MLFPKLKSDENVGYLKILESGITDTLDMQRGLSKRFNRNKKCH